jgi:hypothetical protein
MNFVRHGDGVAAAATEAVRCDTLLFDPPWDLPIQDLPPFGRTLAFCDGFRASNIVRRFGAPTWIFTWDCVSSWYTPNRPLRRAKYCFAYFDIKHCNPRGFRFGSAGAPRIVSNSRGTFAYVPDGEKMFSDVYSSPITARKTNHPHAKPVEWIAYLMRCVGAERVFDPFAGSGAASIAGIDAGICVRAFEIDQPTQREANARILRHCTQVPSATLSLGI